MSDDWINCRQCNGTGRCYYSFQQPCSLCGGVMCSQCCGNGTPGWETIWSQELMTCDWCDGRGEYRLHPEKHHICMIQ